MTHIPTRSAPETLSAEDAASSRNCNQAEPAGLLGPDASSGEIWGWGWLLWQHRRFLARALVWGLAV